jgi:hypothetical protein
MKGKKMETRNFWRPTKAAAARLQALGIRPEWREPPDATMYYGGVVLPDEFVIVRPGTPAEETVIGISSEPVGLVMAEAERLAAERLPLRPGCGSPDGQTAHDEAVAIAAMVACGHRRHEYHGVVMPWWRHEMFGPARRAAFLVACQK